MNLNIVYDQTLFRNLIFVVNLIYWDKMLLLWISFKNIRFTARIIYVI